MNILGLLGSKIEEPKNFNKDLFIKTWCNAGPVALLLGDQDLYTIFVVSEPGKAPRQTLEKFLKTKKAEIHFLDENKIDKVSSDDYCKYVALPLAYALLYPNKPISEQILAARNLFVHKVNKSAWSINHIIEDAQKKQRC